MEFESTSERILVLGIKEFTSANAADVKDDIRRRIRLEHQALDIDMSEVRILDSSGLGTPIAFHKAI